MAPRNHAGRYLKTAELGADAALRKPIQPADLLCVIRDLLAR